MDYELKEYLLSQEGINKVEIKTKDFISELNVSYDEQITPTIIMKYIIIFQNKEFLNIINFDKEEIKDFKILKYNDDICCGYCYKGLVQKLIENEFVKSVNSEYKTDFDIEPEKNIEIIIKYSNKYSEKELIKYIEENK